MRRDVSLLELEKYERIKRNQYRIITLMGRRSGVNSRHKKETIFFAMKEVKDENASLKMVTKKESKNVMTSSKSV